LRPSKLTAVLEGKPTDHLNSGRIRQHDKGHPNLKGASLMSTIQQRQTALRSMYAGLALTVVGTIAPYIDHATTNVLAAHLGHGYPTYTQAHIDSAVTTSLVILSVTGALGVASWTWTIWATKSRKKWARATATSMFAIGTAVALTGLLAKDTSGDTSLAALLAWIGILPCTAGLVAVTTLWHRASRSRQCRRGS
jgi:hypothetical protein